MDQIDPSNPSSVTSGISPPNSPAPPSKAPKGSEEQKFTVEKAAVANTSRMASLAAMAVARGDYPSDPVKSAKILDALLVNSEKADIHATLIGKTRKFFTP